MGFKTLFKRIKKGVIAGMTVVKEQDQTLNDSRILYLIDAFNRSVKKTWMSMGRQYYQVDNDILDRRITKLVDGQMVEETGKANNKLAHGKYKTHVDEKVSYLLSKPYTLKAEDELYANKVKETLSGKFEYNLSLLGYEASNCSIGWLLPYVDEQGHFETMVVPAEQCVPEWTDSSHTELASMIRVYDTQIWEYNKKKTIHNVECWTATGYNRYRVQNSLLVPYVYGNELENGPVAHFRKGDTWQGWGKVPFVPFKNNHVEIPDIKFVKSLLDQYDLSRSEAANYVEEVKNLIFILKGYGGEDIHEFMKILNEDRAIPIDDPQEGGVEALTPTMDITALREHYEQLKRDIMEDGQSINKDLDTFGNNPSGVALKFMYAGLDLKADAMETQFRLGFDSLIYFVNRYLELMEGQNYDDREIEIIFNRNMKINEAEVIDNCIKSKSTISGKTILAHHPYVTDVEEEMAELEKQAEKESFDEIPLQEISVEEPPNEP